MRRARAIDKPPWQSYAGSRGPVVVKEVMHSTWLVGSAIVCVSLAAVPLAAGCSGSTQQQQQPSTSDASDAPSDDSSPGDDAADAGPGIDQDPNVYPSKHQPAAQIDYNGGAILAHVHIVTVTFTGDKHRDSLRAFDHKIASTDWWHQVSSGYCAPPNSSNCVGDGTSAALDGGAWHPDGSTADGGDGFLDVELAYDFPSKSISDSDIQGWLAGHINAGDFPPADDQSLYALYFPSDVAISLGNQSSCSSFGAYHNSTSAGGMQVSYAVMPLCSTGSPNSDFQFLTISASHEFAEAATDAHPQVDTAYYLQSNDAWLGVLSYGGGENGDMCTFTNPESYDESGWTVQRIYSNQAAAKSQNPCEPAVKPAYFGAAVRTQKISVNGHQSFGYVVVPRGKSVDAIADVFSEKPLAHDLLLYTGKPKNGVTDPSDLAKVGNNITVELSRQQVHNGNGVIVSITVPANALAGDYPFVVRAVLAADDYNDWPVIVHVK